MFTDLQHPNIVDKDTRFICALTGQQEFPNQRALVSQAGHKIEFIRQKKSVRRQKVGFICLGGAPF